MSGNSPRNLLLALAALLVVAVAAAQSPVGTAFTYQGQLKSNGTAVDAPNARVVFRLWDAATGGTQVASEYVAYPVPVTGGLLNVPVDFGAAPFNGQARWIEIGVDTTGGTSYTWLAPRQLLTPTPQAQFALNAADLAWPFEAVYAGGSGVNNMLKLDYAGDGIALEVNATGPDTNAIRGTTTEFDTTAVVGQAAGQVSAGVGGYATATGADAANVGGAFVANGDKGMGVYGNAQASAGKNYGVYGRTNSTHGYAGYFYGRGYFSGNVGIGIEEPTQKLDVAGTVKATGLQLATSPVAGYVLTSDAAGVGTWQPAGVASCLWQASGSDIYYTAGHVAIGATDDNGFALRVVNNSGTAIAGECPGEGNYGYLGDEYAGVRGQGYIGVQGTTNNAAGYGVKGENSATTGAACGVYGKSTSTSGRAIYGEATATTGGTYAVYGRATSPSGRGVFGEAIASTGTPIGVDAYAGCPNGYAVSAFNEGESGNAVAVRASSASPDGIAVWASADSDSPTGSSVGVRGETYGAGAGVYGKARHASAVSYGVKGEAGSANGYAGYFVGRGYFSSPVGIGVTNPAQMLDVAGTIQASGFKLTASPTAGYVLTCDANGVGSWQPAAGESLWQLGVGGNIYYNAGNIGVGTAYPATKLDVLGTVKMSGLKLVTNPTAGYVLTADASGNATWQAPAGGGESLWQSGTGGVIYYSGGDVGIGTNAPDADLHVATSSAVRGIHVTGAVNGVVAEGSQTGVRGEGGNYGVYGVGTSYGVRGYCAGAGRGVEAESVSGVGARVTGGGPGTAFPALHVLANNAAGIGIFSVSTSTDANAVFVNKGTGDIIKGFSGATGGDLVFRVENDGKTSVSVLQITGGSDLSEQFDVGATGTDTQPGMVVCIDPENPGKLIVSTKAYDRTVAGIISGAGGVKPGMLMGQRDTVADGQQPVALTGRVYAWADASNGTIQPGDLLTTADVAGHLMRVTDASRAQGAVIGKAMSRLESGRGLVLVLVSLQ